MWGWSGDALGSCGDGLGSRELWGWFGELWGWFLPARAPALGSGCRCWVLLGSVFGGQLLSRCSPAPAPQALPDFTTSSRERSGNCVLDVS